MQVVGETHPFGGHGRFLQGLEEADVLDRGHHLKRHDLPDAKIV